MSLPMTTGIVQFDAFLVIWVIFYQNLDLGGNRIQSSEVWFDCTTILCDITAEILPCGQGINYARSTDKSILPAQRVACQLVQNALAIPLPPCTNTKSILPTWHRCKLKLCWKVASIASCPSPFINVRQRQLAAIRSPCTEFVQR